MVLFRVPLPVDVTRGLAHGFELPQKRLGIQACWAGGGVPRCNTTVPRVATPQEADD